MNVSEIINSNQCVGCLACIDICPCLALSKSISREGFYEPQINPKKCVMCGKCKKVCPVYSKVKKNNSVSKAYVFQNVNYEIRKNSSSGGFFGEAADYILSKGGIVYGVAFDNKWGVKHIRIDDKKDIILLQGSKYVQSDIMGIYKMVKQDLSRDILVCFSGTPCQIAALIQFLGKKEEKLLLIEVICHGVGSPYLWTKYIGNIYDKSQGSIRNIQFRSKEFGYASSSMEVTVDNKHYYCGKWIESFKMLFFKGYNIKPSCFKCEFKGNERSADLSIFDCWHMNIFDKIRDDDKGTTGILVNSQKGDNFVGKLSSKNYVKIVNREDLVKLDGDMVYKFPNKPSDISNYWDDLSMGKNLEELTDIYSPYDRKKRMKINAKLILGKLGFAKVILRGLSAKS